MSIIRQRDMVFMGFSVVYKRDAASEKFMSCKISDLNKREVLRKMKKIRMNL